MKHTGVVLAAALALLCTHCDSTGIRLGGDSSTDPYTDDHTWDPWFEPDLPTSDDSDGDTISDEHEGRYDSPGGHDTDRDGTPDYLDDDSDGDTIPDALESGDMDVSTPPRDADGDYTPDFRDNDSDDNGIPDSAEGSGDIDGDSLIDSADQDNDGDSIEDRDEIGPDPSRPIDWDGDGIPDYNDLDSDNDTITDQQERPWGSDIDADTLPDRHDLDTDGDGIPDATEAGDSDPYTWPVDTDGDGTPDFRDIDSDNDGLSDIWEWENGLNHLSEDTDYDGVPDLIEIGACTDPLDAGSSPVTEGNWYFVVPYEDDPDPSMDTVVLGPATSASTWLTAEIEDDPSDSVDASTFIHRAEPNIVGGVAHPTDPTLTCVGGLSTEDRFPPLDGNPDSFTSVPADTVVCFDLYPARNTTVAPTREPQVYRADVVLVGETGTHDRQDICFLVPPVF